MGFDPPRRSIVVGARVTNDKRALARSMRREPTRSELEAWHLLRDRRCLGVKFRRQQVIRGFIVDFYCPALRLALEIDGPIHDEPGQYDLARDATLATADILTIRLRASEVSPTRLEAIVRATLRLRASSPPSPPAERGTGGEVSPR